MRAYVCPPGHRLYNSGMHHTSGDFIEVWTEKNIEKIVFLDMSDFVHVYFHIHTKNSCLVSAM